MQLLNKMLKFIEQPMQNEKYARFWCVYDNCTQTANADIYLPHIIPS